MGLIAIILLIIFVISALVLMAVILIQDDQGEGLGGIFGAGSTSAFGPRTGNVLTRFTSIIAAVFLISAFMLAFLNRTPESGDLLRKVRAQQTQQGENRDWWVQIEEQPQGAKDSAGGSSASAEDSRAISASASMWGPDCSGGDSMRKNSLEGLPSWELNSIPWGEMPTARVRSRTAGVLAWGTAMPFSSPVLPRLSLASTAS